MNRTTHRRDSYRRGSLATESRGKGPEIDNLATRTCGVHKLDGTSPLVSAVRCEYSRNQQQKCSPRQSRTCDDATPTEQINIQVRSWIDNVIVPILVHKILEERRMQKAP